MPEPVVLPFHEKAHERQPRRDVTRSLAMTITNGARYLGVSERTLSRLLDDRVIPSFHIRSKRMVASADLERYVEEQIRMENA